MSEISESESHTDMLEFILQRFDLAHLKEVDESAQGEVDQIISNGLPEDPEDERARYNLSHMMTISVDTKGAKIYEDSIGYDENEKRVYVMISDTARVLGKRNRIFERAIKHARTAYFGRIIFSMLDHKLVADFLNLHGKHTDGRAIAISFCLTAHGRVNTRSIFVDFARISQPERKQIEEVDVLLRSRGRSDSAKLITALKDVTDRHRSFRMEKAIENSTAVRTPAELLVEECMLMANHAVSQFAYDWKIPILHRVTNEHSVVRYSTQIGYHSVLGIHGVAEVTSPCRVAVGLISHANLRAFLLKRKYPFSEEYLWDIAPVLKHRTNAIRKAQEQFRQYLSNSSSRKASSQGHRRASSHSDRRASRSSRSRH